MFNSKMAVDIGGSSTKVMIGNSRKVNLAGMFSTPEGSIEEGNILMPDEYAKAFQKFIDENSIREKDISVALNSNDIVLKHIEVPIIDEKSLRKSVEWEINQYLPEGGVNHYIDYEILDKINTHEKKVYKILVAAVPKNKIDSYMDLFSSIGLQVNSIDIAANCIARVFKNINSGNKKEESIGIMDIGFRTSNFVILDNGKLFMEKQSNLGIDDMVLKLSHILNVDIDSAYSQLFEKFDFENGEEQIKDSVIPQFDRIFESFERVIQFYTSGKSNKNLDKIYIIGGGGGIKGIETFVSSYFSSSAEVVDSPSKVPVKIKVPNNCDLRIYINNLGLLLRKE